MDHPDDTRDLLRRLMDRTMRYDFTVWFWGDAIALDGLLNAADLLDDERPRRFCLPFFQRWGRRSLTWADHLTPGLALLRLAESTADEGLLAAARRLAIWLLAEVPRAPMSNVPLYRPDLPPYRHTVWVDTLYHEPPFLARLAQLSGNHQYFDAALDLWNGHQRALGGIRGPFLAHSFDTGAGLHRGYGWGRGNGWALLGMIDTLELLPEDHPGFAQSLRSFEQLSAAILSVQDPSGFWRTLLHDREAYLESSTAAFFGAAFTKGVRLGRLGPEYARAAERAWEAMRGRIDADGSLLGVSACTYAATSPGDDTLMYHTLPTETNVWGQGSALRFAGERLRSGFA